MRDTKSAKFQPSAGFWLGQCLLDSDPETARLARWNRRRSLVLSSLIQTALLTAAIVVPLFASQSIPGFRNEPRLARPYGIPIADPLPAEDAGPKPPNHPPHKWSPVISPPHVPDRILEVDDRDRGAHADATPTSGGCPGCVPDGTPGLDPRVFKDFTPMPPAPKAPAPDSRPHFVRVSQPVQEAKLIHRVTPVYPPLMRQIHRSGRVELRAIIARDGTIRELTFVTGDAAFLPAAQEAILQWRYAPTVLNGEPVEVETRITVIFTMTN